MDAATTETPLITPEDTSEGSTAAATPETAATVASTAAAGPKPFDFRHPVFLSSAQWRKLRFEVEEFVESVGALLSTYLRVDFSLQLGKLDTITFNEFTSALPSSTHLTLFKLEPLRGISVAEVRPGLGLGIVDRLLGGPGKPAALDRNLTEMEIALTDQFVQILLDEWCKQWAKLQDLRAEILGHENNPKFLQSSSGDTVLLALTLDARMGECEGQIQLALPYHALEPLVQKLTDTPAPAPATPGSPALPRWHKGFEKVPLTVSAQWPSFKMTTRALLQLRVGDVIDLQAQAAEQIDLRVGRLTKFKGRLGTREKKWAVQITEVCKV